MYKIKAIGSKHNLTTDLKTHEYFKMVEDLITDDMVLQMKNYRHHLSTTCYQHSVNVSYYNYLLCKRFNLNARAGARAGLLHDLFLYDRKSYIRVAGERLHGFRHPKMALSNASNNFYLDNCERDIIEKHMWPLTLTMPKYKETFVIIIVDKYCGIIEMANYFTKPMIAKFRRKTITN